MAHGDDHRRGKSGPGRAPDEPSIIGLPAVLGRHTTMRSRFCSLHRVLLSDGLDLQR